MRHIPHDTIGPTVDGMSMRGMFHFHLDKVLIVLGVWMWIWYAIAKYVLDIEVSAPPFLVCHLLCVIPAAVLTGRGWMIGLVKRLRIKTGRLDRMTE